MAMMNHVDTPFLFGVEKTKLLNCYEYTQLIRQPNIKRPKELDARDILGACLGFCLLDTELGGAPKTVNVKLSDEEENLPHP